MMREGTMAAMRDDAGVMPDKQMMIETVRLLHPGRPVELRALNVDGRGLAASGYFDQPLKLAEAALRYAGRAEGLYITLNPLPAALLARANNTLRERAKATTSDADVLRRAYLPLDLDPVRPSGISASHAEHQAALDQARAARAWLAEQGWHAPLFADSGNGAHLLYALDLPNDAESADLIKRCLAALAGRFDTPEVKLDRSVFNAARIWKLYGSVARKGEHLPERPHRLARLIETPDPLEPVTREQLEVLAASANEFAATGQRPGNPAGGLGRVAAPVGAEGVPPGHAGGGFNRRTVTEAELVHWLEARGAVVWRAKREAGRALYLLEACPFDAGHQRKSFVSLGDEGALGFHCFAASCQDRHWQDLRALWRDAPALGRAAASVSAAAQTGADPLDLSPEEARARLASLAPTMRRFDALLKEDFPPTLWVVPDLVPEGLTLLAAKPKLGKSWLALGLAVAVASGGVTLGKVAVEQGDVLYLALEDSAKRLRHRGTQLLGGQSAPARLEVATTWPRLDEGGLRMLEVWLQGHPDARLIILDTLAKIRGRAKSATLYGEDYASLEPVQALAHNYGVAILVIHHTGKESREDPLDEVNATQGLNGVADNVLVLRRERGRAQATLIGDGRELNGAERALLFDGATGAWTLTEAPPEDQPKTPERAEILDLLKASDGPMSPAQVAKALGKNVNTVRTLLLRMARAGDIVTPSFGKYALMASPVNSVNSVNSSLIEEEAAEERTPESLASSKLTMREDGPSLTELTKLTSVREHEAEAAQELSPASPPSLAAQHRANTAAGGAGDGGGTGMSEEEFIATMMPDARQPYTLMPSGLRPASLAKLPKGSLWPIYGDCTGVFCQGECVCGEHLCDPCGCEAGALIDNRPWYFERREARRGAVCEYCFAPATLVSRWKTPMCERCWQIASRGQGIDPRRYQPRPFGPIEGDEDEEEDIAGD